MRMQFFIICLSLEASCQQTHLLGDARTAGVAKHQNSLGSVEMTKLGFPACLRSSSLSILLWNRWDYWLWLARGQPGHGAVGGVFLCVTIQKRTGWGPRPRKQASVLPDCLYILLPLQVDCGWAMEGKIKDCCKREIRFMPWHAQDQVGRKPPASHSAGLQWPTLQDCSDRDSRKPEPLPLTQHG